MKRKNTPKNDEAYESTFGRPRKKINKEIFESLCRIQCTEREICAVLQISPNTLLKFCKDNYDGATFCDVFNIFLDEGKASIRRIQFKQAEKSPRMAIWLGKQYLGQRDTLDVSADVSDTTKNAYDKAAEAIKASALKRE